MNKCYWNIRLAKMQTDIEPLVSHVIDSQALNRGQKKIVLKRLADLHNQVEALKL